MLQQYLVNLNRLFFLTEGETNHHLMATGADKLALKRSEFILNSVGDAARLD